FSRRLSLDELRIIDYILVSNILFNNTAFV
ncbi:MAG: hypothetical protein ACJAUM_002930, partial [Pseudomonadales bacterium]